MIGANLIGIDSLPQPWKCNKNKERKDQKVCKPEFLQVSTEETAFLIDLKALANSIALDSVLQTIFMDRRTTCLTFGMEEKLQTLYS